MKKFVIGNFKMNTTPLQFSSYLDEFLPRIKECKTNIIFCIPATHFHVAKSRFDATNIKFGAQNISCEESGAFTGEISSSMVKECGADYTLIGHSETRRRFKETLESLNQKIIRALAVNLKVILCIGETKYERSTRKTKLSLKRQLDSALKGIYENELKNIIIAYEPIWSIGTGKTPNVKEIETTVLDIRAIKLNKTFNPIYFLESLIRPSNLLFIMKPPAILTNVLYKLVFTNNDNIQY